MEKSFRNELVLIRVLHGATLREASDEFKISEPRVRGIVYQQIDKLELENRPSLKELRKNKTIYLTWLLRLKDTY